MTEKKKKKKQKGITTKSKKKTAIARATVRKGTGVVRINKMHLDAYQPAYAKVLIEEPIEMAGPVAKEVDIAVSVAGSGSMSQAVAARTSIAKALLAYSKDDKLRKKYLAYDRLLLVDDARRKEPKKPLGRGARKKRQLSFR